jgi:hypothetical protein
VTVPPNDPRATGRADVPRWAWRARGDRDDRATALTSRRGLRVEVKRHESGWAVRPGGHPDLAWAHCTDAELEHTLGLTLGLDAAEAVALARNVREGRG